MSSSCNGASPTCKCGCKSGRCTCKQIKLKDAWQIAVKGMGLLPIGPLGSAILSYVDNLLQFPFFIKEFTDRRGEEIRLTTILATPGLSDEAYKDAELRLDALYIADKIRSHQKTLSTRGDETMEIASAAMTVFGFFTSLAKYFDFGITTLDTILRKIPNSCICEPCGDDTPPKNPIDGEKDKKPYDPLAFDLNNDGTITTINVDDSKVYIDVDNDGLGEKIGWVSGEDGLLF